MGLPRQIVVTAPGGQRSASQLRTNEARRTFTQNLLDLGSSHQCYSHFSGQCRLPESLFGGKPALLVEHQLVGSGLGPQFCHCPGSLFHSVP